MRKQESCKLEQKVKYKTALREMSVRALPKTKYILFEGSKQSLSRTNDEVIFKIEIQTNRLPQQIKNLLWQ